MCQIIHRLLVGNSATHRAGHPVGSRVTQTAAPARASGGWTAWENHKTDMPGSHWAPGAPIPVRKGLRASMELERDALPTRLRRRRPAHASSAGPSASQVRKLTMVGQSRADFCGDELDTLLDSGADEHIVPRRRRLSRTSEVGTRGPPRRRSTWAPSPCRRSSAAWPSPPTSRTLCGVGLATQKAQALSSLDPSSVQVTCTQNASPVTTGPVLHKPLRAPHIAHTCCVCPCPARLPFAAGALFMWSGAEARRRGESIP